MKDVEQLLEGSPVLLVGDPFQEYRFVNHAWPRAWPG